MSARAQARLWLAQRITAALLGVCVTVHLATIIYAVRGGLSAEEIFSRTRGNHAWLAFYVVFVLAAAVHAPIGLRAIAIEWLGWRARSRDVALAVFALVLIWLGLRAAFTVFL